MDTNELIEDVKQLKEKQELHRKQLKENREKVIERKRRTHRLIVRGAIAEAFIENATQMTDEEFQSALYAKLHS